MAGFSCRTFSPLISGSDGTAGTIALRTPELYHLGRGERALWQPAVLEERASFGNRNSRDETALDDFDHTWSSARWLLRFRGSDDFPAGSPHGSLFSTLLGAFRSRSPNGGGTRTFSSEHQWRIIASKTRTKRWATSRHRAAGNQSHPRRL
jgi:hypothetical protein